MLRNFKNYRDGIIALPIVILLTIIIVSIAVGLSSVSYNENTNSLGIAKSATAMSYAVSGVRDALQRIARNNAYSETTWDTNPASDGSYKININSPTGSCATVLDGCARIRVDYSSGKSPSIITSEGTAGSYVRKMQVDAIVDANGTISSTTGVEIKTLPTISTAQASSIATTSATLNGWTNSNSNTVTSWFRYCKIGDTGCVITPPSACDDSFGTKVTVSGTQTGNFLVSISTASVTGLSSSTTYYYCAIANDGTNTIFGNVFAFNTL